MNVRSSESQRLVHAPPSCIDHQSLFTRSAGYAILLTTVDSGISRTGGSSDAPCRSISSPHRFRCAVRRLRGGPRSGKHFG
jgi:hypothetical protein